MASERQADDRSRQRRRADRGAVDATLADLPVVTDMSGKRKGAAGGDDGGRPWFRGWWAPALVGVSAAIVTTAIVMSFSSSPDVDGTVSIPAP